MSPKKRAEAVVDYLFTNGTGRKATMLVLVDDGDATADLGGWGRHGVHAAIEDAIRAAVAEAVAGLGSRGGKARAAKLTPEQRAEIARKAANARWAKADKVNGTGPA